MSYRPEPPPRRSRWLRWCISTATASLLVAMLALTGCAFSSALGKGDFHAGQREWPQAAQAYREALELQPDSAVAAAKLEEAKAQAARSALAAGRGALAQRDHRAALDALNIARSYDPENNAADVLEREVEADLLARVADEAERNNLVVAHTIALEASTLFQGSRDVAVALDDVRARIVASARQAAERGQYERAHDALEGIASREPGQRGALRADRDAVRAAWAEVLRRDAEAHLDKSHLGAAFVQFAHAASLSNHSSDVEATQRLRAQLVQRGELSVHTEVSGAPARATRLRDAIGRHVGAKRGVKRVDSASAASLKIGVTLDAVTFEEAREVQVGRRNYVSGTKQIRNPDYVSAQRALISLERELARVERDELTGVQELVRVERELDRAFERDGSSLRRRLRRGEEELDKVEDALEEAQDVLERVRAERDAARSENRDDNSIRDREQRAQNDVKRAREGVRRARKELEKEMQALRSFRESMRATRADIERCRQELAKQRERVLAKREDLSRAHERLIGLEPLIDQDVVSVFRYEIARHTRAAKGVLRLSLTAPTGPARVARLTATASTSDQAHRAHVAYDIGEDALRFPLDDASLEAAVDDKLHKAILARIDAAVTSRSADLVARAREKTGADLEAATTLYVVHALTRGGAAGDTRAFLIDRFGEHAIEVVR